MPKVTILMPVYNGEKYLEESINSILNQTFTNFEFLIINDGSTDDSVKIIKSYNDPRIKLVHNEHNIGLAETCNRGIELALGEYIARMDSDDISLPERLFKQVKFMDLHSEIGVAGTWAKIIGENDGYVIKKQTNNEQARASLLFNTCFVHPTVIMRKEVVKKSGIRYRKEFDPGDDYVFWTEIIDFTEFANLPEILLLYRMHPTNISKVKSENQINGARQARLNMISKLGISPTEEEFKIHSTLLTQNIDVVKFLDRSEVWLAKLLEANENGYFDKEIFKKIIANRWLAVSHANALNGWIVWKKFRQSRLSEKILLNYNINVIKFILKILSRNLINNKKGEYE